MKGNAILLSVQPKYVEKIFAGEKKVELRRIRPRVNKGDLVIIYASSPVMAVFGSFMVDHVVTRHPSELWPVVEHFACISRKEFDKYYKGSIFGVAIFFSKARPINEPLRLGEIRKRWPEFHPPQGYRYLASMDNRVNRLLSSVIG